MTGPVFRLALSLQRQLKEQRRRNTILSCAYARTLTRCDVLNRERGQAIVERDEAFGLVTDLRIDLAALELVNAELMRSCPTDAREIEHG